MKKLLFLTLATFSIVHCQLSIVKAQGEADNWYFGYNAGLKFIRDGNGRITGTQPLHGGKLDQLEGCATISDADGQLLFYSDGRTVYNKNHGIMQNGQGLMGDNSSSQSAVMVPRPGHPNNYYIFTVPAGHAPANGMRYSEVDMTLDGGKGGILASNKNTHLFNGTSEKIAAVRHTNGVDYWMLAHEYNNGRYRAYLVTASGVQTSAVISAVGEAITSGSDPWLGYMIVSPDGKRVAAVHSYSPYKAVELLDFDSATGKFKHRTKLDLPEPGNWNNQGYAYGVAFSPNSDVLYASVHNGSGTGIYQWNLKPQSGGISATRLLLPQSGGLIQGALQLGPDGRIYSTRPRRNSLDRINCPNTVGAGCGYQRDAVNIAGESAYGLPPFMASFFNTPPKQIKIMSESQPMPGGSGIQLSLTGMGGYTKIDWDFGDGQTVSDQTTTNITHVYDEAGYYTVKATLKGNACDPEAYVFFTFFVGEPKLDAPAPTTICAPSLPVELALKKDIGALEPYVWKEKISGTAVGTGTNVTVAPAATTTYTVSTRVLDVWNRFTNGSFENAASHGGYGMIAVDPKTVLSGINPGFVTTGMPDVNPGEATGKKLAVDARGRAGQAFWKQAVPDIVPNREYIVSFYHRRLTSGTSPSNIRIQINGALVGPSFVPVGDWEKAEYTWNSGAASGNIDFELVETTGSSGENFFVLDDIVLNKIKEVEAEVTVTVNDVNPGSIAADQLICAGNSASQLTSSSDADFFTPGGTGTPVYLWQQSPVGASGPWTDIAGTNSNVHSPGSPGADTWYRRVVTYTNDGTPCTKETPAVYVHVNEAKPGAIGPLSQTICQNEEAKLTSEAEGYANDKRTYKWYSRMPGGSWTEISNAIAKDYTSPNVTEDTEFKRVTISTRKDPLGNNIPCEAESNVVRVVVTKIDPPTGDATQRDCAPGVIGAADRKLDWLMAAGTDLKWYDAAQGGNEITNDPNLTDGGTYYASQTLNNCESYERLEVKYVKDVLPVGGEIALPSGGGFICHYNAPPLLISSDDGSAEGYIWKIKNMDIGDFGDELTHFGSNATMQPKVQLEDKYLDDDKNHYRRYAYRKNTKGEYCMKAALDDVSITIIHVNAGSILGNGTVVCEGTDIGLLGTNSDGTSLTHPTDVEYRWYEGANAKTSGWSATDKTYIPMPSESSSHGVLKYTRHARVRHVPSSVVCFDTTNVVTVTIREAKYTDGGGNPTCGLFPQKTVVDLGPKKNMKADADETLTYTITVKNEWDRPVHNVVVSDAIPNGTVYVQGSGTNDHGRQEVGSPVNEIKWTIPTLNPKGQSGSEVSVSFDVTVEGDLTNYPAIANEVRLIDTDDMNADLPDGKEEADVDIETVRRFSISRDLTVKKVTGGSVKIGADGKLMAKAEDELEYTITVKNGGDVDLPNVIVKDALPVGMEMASDETDYSTYPSVTPTNSNPMEWTIGTLPWNQSVDLKFKAKVKKDLTGVDSIRNTAIVADTLMPKMFLKTDPVSSMEVTKEITNLGSGTGENGKFEKGNKIEYKITVKNTGNLDIHNIAVTDSNADNPNVGTITKLRVNDGSNSEWQWISPIVIHTVTQADVDAGMVANLAEVAGTDANGSPVTANSEAPNGQTGNDCTGCHKDSNPPNDGSTVTAIDPGQAKVAITKTAVPQGKTDYKANEDINYRITVRNTGDRTLKDVEMTDPNANGGPWKIPSLPPYDNGNNPSGEWTFTVSHEVLQDDMDLGYVDNTARVTTGEDDLKMKADPKSDSETVLIKHDPKLTVTKTITSTGKNNGKYELDPGTSNNVIDYKIVVHNTGLLTLKDILVEDPNADTGSLQNTTKPSENPTILELKPNEFHEFTAKHTVTQDDVDLGQVVNTATALGFTTHTNVTADDNDQATAQVHDTGSAMEVTKELVDPTKTDYKENDPIAYKIVVKNPGSLTLRGIELQDQYAVIGKHPSDIEIHPPGFADLGSGGLDGDILRLAPGGTVTYKATHKVDQADIDRGQYDNWAVANGGDARGNPLNVESEDPNPCMGCKPVTGHPTATSVQIDQDPKMEMTKKVMNPKPQDQYKVDDEIHYRITVTNTGNVTLKDITVLDENADEADANHVIKKIQELAPGVSDETDVSHKVTQADVDKGGVKNLATATGEDPNKDSVTAASEDPDDPNSSPGDPTEVTIGQTKDLEITKKADRSKTDYQAGEKIRYTITVTNTGNTTIKNVTVSDPNADLPNTWTYTDLLPGTEVINATHTVTPTDITKGYVDNLATIAGTDYNGDPITAESTDPDCPVCDETTVPVTKPDPAMAMDKRVVNKVDMPFKEGDMIKYEITVRNTGNVPLLGLAVTDANADAIPGIVGKNGEANPIPVLMPEQVIVFTAQHTVTPTDVAAGHVDNLATAKGKEPSGADVTAASTDPDCPECPETTVPIGDAKPSIAMDKKVTNKADMPFRLGDKIKYEITVRNSGNVPLLGLAVTDANADATPGIVGKNGDANPIPVLMPEQVIVFTAQHTVTPTDVSAGHVDNLATAKGKDPNGDEVTADSTDPDCPECLETTVPIGDAKPSIAMEKAVTNKANMPFRLGDKIKYEITVRNTGNVPVHKVDVTDPNADSAPTSADSPNPIPVLMPGQAIVFVAEHTVTPADVATGYVNNLATAGGKDSNGGDVTAESTDPDCPECPETSIPIGDPNPAMAVDKAVVGGPADPAKGYAIGEAIEYAITVRNTGNVTLRNIVLTDARADEENNAPWERTVAVLAPGLSSETFTAYHTVTQDDVDAGGVLNIARTSGQDPNGAAVTAESTDPGCPGCTGPGTEVRIDRHPGMEVTKSADWEKTYLRDDVIDYEIIVRNTGNVTLYNVKVEDDNGILSATGVDEADNPVPNPIPVLKPGRSVTFTATHKVTQADIDAVYVRNLAVATGDAPNGDEVSEESVPPQGYGDPEDPAYPEDPTSTIVRVGIIPIVAEDDTFLAYAAQDMATGSVLTNDTFDGRPATRSSRVALEPGTPDDPTLMQMDADGTIHLGRGLRPGRYAYPYTIRQRDYPSNYAEAVAYVDVVDPKRGLHIPNVFTPNGDGVNDTFEILGLPNFDRISLRVFTRYGNEVYVNEDYRNDWDANNPEVLAGTYFYLIEAHKEGHGTEKIKGWVTVMRRKLE